MCEAGKNFFGKFLPCLTLQVKLTALKNDIYDDGTSPDFSIEMVSYEYSDMYKLMEGAG